MTIYCDKNKQAYGFEILNPNATIDDDTWAKYANTDKWDIVNGKFKDITNTQSYIKAHLKESISAKLEENDKKADEKRYNQTFTLTIQKKECLFDTSAKTNSDIQTATLYILAGNETYDGWISNNGIVLNLTKDDVVAIASKIRELANVYPTWKKYYDKINSCTTIEEVNAIEIEY